MKWGLICLVALILLPTLVSSTSLVDFIRIDHESGVEDHTLWISLNTTSSFEHPVLAEIIGNETRMIGNLSTPIRHQPQQFIIPMTGHEDSLLISSNQTIEQIPLLRITELMTQPENAILDLRKISGQWQSTITPRSAPVIAQGTYTLYPTSMRPDLYNPDSNYCDNGVEYVYSDKDRPQDEFRTVMYINPNDVYIPPSEVITSAILHVYINSVFDDGTMYGYSSLPSGSRCDSCMSWNDAFGSCGLEQAATQVFTERMTGSDESAFKTIDITSTLKTAHNQGRSLFVYFDGLYDSDKIVDVILGGSDDYNEYPYITLETRTKDCYSGPCCDADGFFKSSSAMCQNDVSTEYGCPTGTGAGSGVFTRHQDQYCSGSSDQCTGSLIPDGWNLYQSCSLTQVCVPGATQCTDIACSQDSQCGIVSTDSYCQNNDRYTTTNNPLCLNAGTLSSQCSIQTSTSSTDCGENTYQPWGASFCQGGNLMHSRTVYLRGCQNNDCYNTASSETSLEQTCTYGCSTLGGSAHCISPACVSDSGCPSDTFVGNTYCQNDDVYQVSRDYSCLNGATESATCSYSDSGTLVQDCAYGCIMSGSSGVCDPNAAPVVNSVASSAANAPRGDAVTISCSVTDVTDNPSTLQVSIHYSDRVTGWQNSAATYTSGNGNTGIFSAQITPAPTAILGPWDLRCQVRDPAGRQSAWLVAASAFTVIDHPTEFTIDVVDHTTEDVPAIAGSPILFTTNIYDPDNLIKLVICDANGRSGSSCANRQYCSDGLKTHGAFSCAYYSTVDENSGPQSWTSFAVDDKGMVFDGASGEFYLINKPLNPTLRLGSTTIWNPGGYFGGKQTITFTSELATQLLCQQDLCTLGLTATSESSGFLDLTDLRIFYGLYQNYPPQIHRIDNITVYEGELVNITPSAFDPNGDPITFTISDPVGDDGIWIPGEDDDGDHQVTITAIDGHDIDSTTITINVKEAIDPDAGGLITHNNLTIMVPPGALPAGQFTVIDVNELDETSVIRENGLKVLGKVYRLEPSGMVFSPPLQVEVNYDETLVANESAIDAFYYKLIDAQRQVYRWVALGAQVDTVHNVVRFNLTHFSEYALQEIDGDTEAPEITITSPEQREYYHDQAIPIQFAVNDLRDISPQISILLDGSPISYSVISARTLGAGAHTLKIIASDESDNSNHSTVNFTIVDFSAPMTTANAPIGWQRGPVTITLSPSDNESTVPATLYCIDQTDTCLPSTNGSIITVSNPGVYFVRYFSIDSRGNQEPRQSTKVQIDFALPSTTINHTTRWNAGPVDIAFTATDNESGVSGTFSRVDGAEWNNGTTSIITGEGEHLLEYYSTDIAGNQELTKNITIGIDMSPPITADNSVVTWDNSIPNITLSCTDNLSGCGETWHCVLTQFSPLCSWVQGTTPLISCPHPESCLVGIKYYSVDLAGNKEKTVKTKQIHLDDTAPQLLRATPGQNQSYSHQAPLVFDVLVNDTGSGINTLNATLDKNSSISINQTISPLALGNHSIDLIATDIAGNTLNITWTFTITNTAPIILSPFPDPVLSRSEGDTVHFVFYAQDADKESLSYHWTIDGQAQPEHANELIHRIPYTSGRSRIVQATVSDNYTSSSYIWNLTITDVDFAPEIISFTPHESLLSLKEGDTARFVLEARDPDSDPLNISWALDDAIIGNGTELNYTPDHRSSGNHILRARVSDPSGDSAEHVWTLSIIDVNVPPTLVVNNITAFEGELITLSALAEDFEGDNLSYLINDNRFTQNNNTFTFQTGYTDSSSSDVLVSVTDSAITINTTVRVTIYNSNRRPTIDLPPELKKHILVKQPGEDIALTFGLYDEDGDPLSAIVVPIIDTLSPTSPEEAIESAAQRVIAEPSEGPSSLNYTLRLSNLSLGVHGYHLFANDTTTTTSTEFIVAITDRPFLDLFGGDTSNLSLLPSLREVPELVLDWPGYARVRFAGPLDLEGMIDFVNPMLFNKSIVGIDSSVLTKLRDHPAHITFYDMDIPSGVPILDHSSSLGTDNLSRCLPPQCTNITYANNEVGVDVSHFSTYVVRAGALHSLSLPSSLTLEADDQGSIRKSFELVNTGDGALDVTLSAPTSIPLTLSANSFSLARGESRTITVQGHTEELPESAQQIGMIRATADRTSAEMPVSLATLKRLRIADLEIRTQERSYNHVSDGQSIKAPDDSTIVLDIKVENTFTQHVFDDVIIRAETDDDDDHSDSFKLRPGATSSKRLTIDHEQGDDEIQITLTGEDDSGIEHELRWEIPLEHIDREHDLDIIEARITPSQVSCDATTMLSMRIENRGRSDERGSILIKKDPLRLDLEQDLNIERDETGIFNFNITLRDAPSGHWSIPLEVLSSDRKILARSEASLEVLGCLKHVTSVAQSIAETPEPPKVRAQARQTPSSPSRTSSLDPLIWFIGFVLAANILVAAILVTIVLKKRR